MMLSLLVACSAAIGSPDEGTHAEQPADVVLVCPEGWMPVLKPWILHRQQQGHRLVWVSSVATAEAIRNAIVEHSKAGGLKSVVLVGDVPQLHQRAVDPQQLPGVPAHFIQAKVSVAWNSEPLIATDNPYGDLDGDGIPELAVGRLSADSLPQLAVILQKILAYEKDAQGLPRSWRRKVHLVAGVGGFGVLADALIETAAKKLITDDIPSEYQVVTTYGSWRSPFCPDPRAFGGTTLATLNEGSLFWVYIGHGYREGFDVLRVPGSAYRVFDRRDVRHLRCVRGQPVAVLLACYTGAFDGQTDCLGEVLLQSRGGPVAVIGGSRVTMPYGMAVLGTGMLDAYFADRKETLGEVFLQAKQAAMQDGAGRNVKRRMLDGIASLVSPRGTSIEDERREHLALMNLLGDPLLRVRPPLLAEVACSRNASAGSEIEVAFESPIDGTAYVELVCHRSRTIGQPPVRAEYPADPTVLVDFNRVYREANDRRYIALKMEAAQGENNLTISIPESAQGACHVRVAIEGTKDFAAGGSDVYIRKAAVIAAENE